VIVYPSDVRYEGDIANSMPNGLGVLIFPNGKKQKGVFQNGAYKGK
jgi:hypothetical protein